LCWIALEGLHPSQGWHMKSSENWVEFKWDEKFWIQFKSGLKALWIEMNAPKPSYDCFNLILCTICTKCYSFDNSFGNTFYWYLDRRLVIILKWIEIQKSFPLFCLCHEVLEVLWNELSLVELKWGSDRMSNLWALGVVWV